MTTIVARVLRLGAGVGAAIAITLGGIAPVGATPSAINSFYLGSCNTRTDVCEPSGIAIDPSGTLWVGDLGNDVMTKISADGSTATDVVDQTNVPGLGYIIGVAYANGYIYFSDTGNDAIWRIPDSATSAASTTPELVSQSPALSASPWTLGVAVDGSGDVFWSDGQSTGHVYEHVAGTPTSSYVTFGTGLDAPVQIAFGPDGKLYVADYGDSSVMVLPLGGGTATTYVSDPSTTGTGLTSLAFAPDGSGTLYVIDGSQGSVVGVSQVARTTAGTAGTVSVVAPNTGNVISLPAGVAFGPTGLLFPDIGNGNIWSTTVPDLAPGQPQNLAATTTATSATVTWAPPLYVGSGVTSYTVSVQPGGASCTVAAKGPTHPGTDDFTGEI